MANKLGYRMTSLTLMVIMLAGGMTIAATGFVPDAYADHNANLFVSAEQTGGYVNGLQIVEVVVIDANIPDGSTPDVTIDGDVLLMTETAGGDHYAYFASYSHIKAVRDAHAYNPDSGPGLDFGNECNSTNEDAPATLCNAEGVVKSSKDDAQSTGIWPFIQLYKFSDAITIQYNQADSDDAQITNLSFGTSDDARLATDRETYPAGAEIHVVINDHRLNIDPTSADVWTWDAAGTSMYYGLNEAETDDQGNINDNDISSSSIFDSDLVCDGCSLEIDFNPQNTQTDVIENVASDNRPVNLVQDGSDYLNERWVSVQEVNGPNTGVFTTTDADYKSTLKTTSDAQSNTSATIGYDGALASVLVRHATPTISIESLSDRWESGLSIPITIVDENANKNSKLDERLSVANIDSVIPTLVIGDPFTLVHSNTTTWIGYTSKLPNDEATRLVNTKIDPTSHDDTKLNLSGDSHSDPFSIRTTDTLAFLGFKNVAEIEPSSHRLLLTFNDDFDDLLQTSVDALKLTPDSPFLTGFPLLILDLDFTDLKDVLINNAADDQSGINMISYDISSLGGDDASLNKLQINIDRKRTAVVETSGSSGYIRLPDAFVSDIYDSTSKGRIQLILHVSGMDIRADTQYPVAVDFFTFGFKNNGSDIVADQIIRLELEESTDNQGTFEGTLEYATVNQFNILDESVYAGVSPISDHAGFIATESLVDGSTDIQIMYQDLGAGIPYTLVDKSIVLPGDRIDASNLRVVDSSGNALGVIAVDRQVQVSADLSNNQDRDQSAAYLVQVQDSDGVTVALSWISGLLPGNHSFNPAVSWTPTEAGTYTVTAFVWESVDNPTILSPSISIDVYVT